VGEREGVTEMVGVMEGVRELDGVDDDETEGVGERDDEIEGVGVNEGDGVDNVTDVSHKTSFMRPDRLWTDQTLPVLEASVSITNDRVLVIRFVVASSQLPLGSAGCITSQHDVPPTKAMGDQA
jgi:hypothetical protein